MASTRALRVVGALCTLALVGLFVLAAPPAEGRSGGIQPVSQMAVMSAQSLPAPPISDGVDAWTAPAFGFHLIDDFEGTGWPDGDVWGYVLDLTGDADGEFHWAPTDCRASEGQRSLWAVGGGSGGQSLACDADYPAAQQASALLALDLTALHSAAETDLVFDVWADASPYEGLLINYVSFVGTAQSERRTVYSATGRVTDWSRDIRLDLSDLRDSLDPSWHLDLRGQTGYLELLFISVAGNPTGNGIMFDNLRLHSLERPPVVVTGEPTITPTPKPTYTPSPTPPPTDRTEACTTEPDCRTIIVEAFDDYRCDGVFRRGRDKALRGTTRVEITAGVERLGAPLGAWGSVYFKVPMAAGADITVKTEPSYINCQNSSNPRRLELSDTGAKWTHLTFGFNWQ